MENQNLFTLTSELLDAKKKETEAKQHRLFCEERLLPFLATKEEGSKTTIVSDSVTVTVKSPIYRKLDSMLWGAIAPVIPAQLHPVKIKTEVDAKGLRFLEEHEHEMFLKVAKCITATPGKPLITIKVK